MPVNFPENKPYVGQYEANGSLDALGPASLTMLARSFEEVMVGDLEDYFPTRKIAEREITVEQIIEGLGIMPLVRMGMPDGSFSEGPRIRSFSTSPFYLRESDFLTQALINQLRKPETIGGGIYSPTEIVAERMKRLMARRQRTIQMLRCMCMLGGINHRDPRTQYSADVSTNIPTHNLFSYKGANAATVALAAGSTIPGTSFVKGPYPMVTKTRQEVLLFTDATGRAGIPWTDPQADIPRAVRLLKQFYQRTNKNKATEILMNSSLYTLLHENEIIKAYAGGLGLIGAYGAVAGNAKEVSQATITSGSKTPGGLAFNADGELQSIAGLRIRLIDGLYRNPETNEITNYWPAHKVVISSPRHYDDASATLGMTHHPVGEAPSGQPGVWSYASDTHQPPAAPGRTMQVGDCMLPFATYPHWIMVLDVCEPNWIKDNLIIDSLDSYGTF